MEWLGDDLTGVVTRKAHPSVCGRNHSDGSDRLIRKGERWWMVRRGQYGTDVLCDACYRQYCEQREQAASTLAVT